MNNRERLLEGPTPATRTAQPLDRGPQVGVNAPSLVMWQASGVGVPPVLGSPAGISIIQQLKGNRAVGQMLAVQRDSETQEAVAKPNHSGLPENLKAGIESLSGMSMDAVRVHYNSSQPAQLNALAYTQGTEIYIAPGQERHLPHEAWHVVQQAQGRVQPTMQMKDGVLVNDDKELEREADVMGKKAASEYNQHFDANGADDSPGIPKSRGKTVACQCVACSAARTSSATIPISADAKRVHQLTSIRITDGQEAERGQSGDPTHTEVLFTYWPDLLNKFTAIVKPKKLARVTANGKIFTKEVKDEETTKDKLHSDEYTDIHVRGPFECAEPNALGRLLWKYIKNSPLKDDYMKSVRFPKMAMGDHGPMPPCPVCSQWVDGAKEPLPIKDVFGKVRLESKGFMIDNKMDQKKEPSGSEKLSADQLIAEIKDFYPVKLEGKERKDALQDLKNNGLVVQEGKNFSIPDRSSLKSYLSTIKRREEDKVRLKAIETEISDCEASLKRIRDEMNTLQERKEKEVAHTGEEPDQELEKLTKAAEETNLKLNNLWTLKIALETSQAEGRGVGQE